MKFFRPKHPPAGATGLPESRGAAHGLRVQVVVAVTVAVVALSLALLLWVTRDSEWLGIDLAVAYSALLLVAVSAPVVLVVLMRRLPRPTRPLVARGRPVWLSPVTACVVLSIGLTTLGWLAYLNGRELVLKSARHQLEAVATLKASLIEAWLEDARNDIRIWNTSREFLEALQAWRSGGAHESEAHRRLLDFLWRLSKTAHYAEVGIRDARSGEVLMTTGRAEDSPELRRQAVLAAHATSPLIEDFHSGANGEHDVSIYLGIFASLAPPAVEQVVTHVGFDPIHEFFPLIEQWPGATDSAEQLLMRREHGAMVILNDARRRKEGPPPHGLTIGATQYIAGELLRGDEGFIRGYDDRERPVLAYAQHVARTSWILVAKIDEAEAFAELNRTALLVASITGALLLLGTWWWVEHRRVLAIEQRFQHERAEQGHQLAELSQRVVSVQENERLRLAAELHDRTGANLATIKINLRSLARSLPQGEPDVLDLLSDTDELLTDTVTSIREFCGDLRPSILDYGGLAPALEDSVKRFNRRTEIAVHIDLSGYFGRCAPKIESVLYRIAQEALLNCAKHSQASRVNVRLARDAARVSLTIEDDGVGFDPGQVGRAEGNTGSGILNMRARATFAGATFELDSLPGRGTRIVVDL